MRVLEYMTVQQGGRGHANFALSHGGRDLGIRFFTASSLFRVSYFNQSFLHIYSVIFVLK